MTILLAIAFALVGLTSLAVPWVGAVAAYLFAVLSPQSIWFWNFAEVRPALFVTAPLLAGTLIALFRRTLHFDAVRNGRTAMLVGLVVLCAASTRFGPYSDTQGEGIRNAAYILEVQFKIVLLMIVGSLVASAERPLRAMAWMLVACCTYLVYWANDLYLSRGWVIRLGGPADPNGSGPYLDENNFAAFFVATLPFIWFMAREASHPALRWALLLVVPFGWHAIFLTGSRGGLLGIGAVLLFIALRSGQRVYGAMLIGAFVVAFAWQAGDVMKERAAGIDDYREDDSATGRLDAWAAASRMMSVHPLTGVGPGAFLTAFPSYSEKTPLQAHNTYFQIGAEYGPLAAVLLLGVIASCLLALLRRSRELANAPPDPTIRSLRAINEATLTGLLGVFVCSMFLTLQLFEILYCLIFMANAVDACVRRTLARAGPAAVPAPDRPDRRPVAATPRRSRTPMGRVDHVDR